MIHSLSLGKDSGPNPEPKSTLSWSPDYLDQDQSGPGKAGLVGKASRTVGLDAQDWH